MKTYENIEWVYYVEEEEAAKLEKNKCGKWMFFFYNMDFATDMCSRMVEEGIVCEAKHTNGPTGVCCCYLNYDDNETHKKCLGFFLENDLIRKTKTGKLYNISFKLDRQTLRGDYGKDFRPELRLSDFVDLETRQFIV